MTKRRRSNGRLLTWEDISNIVLAILFILMLCALLVIFVCIIFNDNGLPKLLNCSLCYLCFDYIILSILNILLEVSKLEYFLNSKEHILRGGFLATFVLSSSKKGRLWNQGLVNLDFDDNKIRFRTNYYISNMIR